MFENAMNQSNPIFGEITEAPDPIKMAKCGYTTPVKFVHYMSGEEIDDTDLSKKLEMFLITLRKIAMKHDENIRKDSELSNEHVSIRRGFLFVTVPGNKYLEAIWTDPTFKNWAEVNNVGIYMTSSPFDNEADPNGFRGGCKIKKAESHNWIDGDKRYTNNDGKEAVITIGDFMSILKNDEYSQFKDLNLTEEEINTHINLLININQCNTGVNLPALNGVYIAKFIDLNSPLVIQIPGRVSRPDEEDVPYTGNPDNCPIDSENPVYKYIKPFSYIYTSDNDLDKEEMNEFDNAMQLMYTNFYLVKNTFIKPNTGTGKKKQTQNGETDDTDLTVDIEIKNKDYQAVETEHDLLKLTLEKYHNKLNKFIAEYYISDLFDDIKLNEIFTKYNIQNKYTANELNFKECYNLIKELERNKFLFCDIHTFIKSF